MFRIKRFFSFIKDAGGSFAKREIAQEEQYIHEHEKQVIADLKQKIEKSDFKKENKEEIESNSNDSSEKIKTVVKLCRVLQSPMMTFNITRLLSTQSIFRSNIRDAGGAFGKREIAQEEQFIHEHEREVIADLKKKISETKPATEETVKETPSVEKTQAKSEGSTDHITLTPSNVQKSGVFSRKESASEEKYFRDHDLELAKNLKKDEKK